LRDTRRTSHGTVRDSITIRIAYDRRWIVRINGSAIGPDNGIWLFISGRSRRSGRSRLARDAGTQLGLTSERQGNNTKETGSNETPGELGGT
jgi:hypothetical protein